MLHFVLDCPHCNAKNMTMKVHHRALVNRMKLGIAYGQCGTCELPVSIIVGLGQRGPLTYIAEWVSHGGPDVVASTGVEVKAVFPEAQKVLAPKHVPENTVRVYVQAVNAQKQKQNDNAGMAFRKTLDIGLNEYDSSLKGKLRDRIDKLADNHVITESMRDWAHQIRLLGNEFTHEPDEPTDDEIEALAGFTDALLRYLFTLPEEVEQRKAATLSAG